MNAPWKPGSSGTRDPFAAYICDEPTLDIVRALAINMGWAPEKCAKGGLRNAVQSLSITASPNILLVDLSESGDPLNDINALAEVCEPGTVVIAMGQVNDVRLYRDLISSGLHDYLLKPVSPDQHPRHHHAGAGHAERTQAWRSCCRAGAHGHHGHRHARRRWCIDHRDIAGMAAEQERAAA